MPTGWHAVEMLRCVIAVVFALLTPLAHATELRGHGGPVRAIALARDGETAMTASFDSTLILWSLESARAVRVLRFHEGAVNSVVALPDGRFASAGEDGKIALWRVDKPQPERVLTGHSAPVVALAVSPDGTRLASASWDGSARIWPLAGGEPHVHDDHRANVNGVGFLPDGSLVTGAYDGAVRLFPAIDGAARKLDLGIPVNALAVRRDGAIVLAGADGKVRTLSAALEPGATHEVADTPLATLALSLDGRLIAAAGFRGALALIDPASGVVRRLEGPAFPLWSMAFSADARDLYTGGNDRVVRRWSVTSGEPATPVVTAANEDIPFRLKDHPGAAVFRACVACHTLTTDAGARAGPTLAGLYGRKIGTAAGYDYSPALRKMDIVWSRETLQRLFELGPTAYTPGTKMPEQIVGRAEDRAALAEFLELADRERVR